MWFNELCRGTVRVSLHVGLVVWFLIPPKPLVFLGLISKGISNPRSFARSELGWCKNHFSGSGTVGLMLEPAGLIWSSSCVVLMPTLYLPSSKSFILKTFTPAPRESKFGFIRFLKFRALPWYEIGLVMCGV